jgi:gas vesicle protein
VGEDHTRGNTAASGRESAASSGWVTTQVAAKSLGISPRTVRWHIEHENLVAKPEGEGVRRSWLVSIDSVQAFRDSRQRQGQLPGRNRVEPGDADIAAESSGNAIRELADRLVEEAARASEYRVRLELSEKAQSTLEEQLDEERRLREKVEQEREDFRQQLAAHRLAREVAETAEEAPERAEPRPATGGAQEDPQRRPWWKRVFRG